MSRRLRGVVLLCLTLLGLPIAATPASAGDLPPSWVQLRIDGDLRVGEDLTATVLNPVEGLTYRLGWIVEPQGGDPGGDGFWSGTAIDQATFTLPPPYVGRRIGAFAVAMEDGQNVGYGELRTADPVAPGTLTTTVIVQGEPRVGRSLSAQSSYSNGSEHTYQWWRGTTPIPGATGQVYRLRAADLGARVSARITTTALGYDGPSTAASPGLRIGLPATHLTVRAPRRVVPGSPFVVRFAGLRAGERFTLLLESRRIHGYADRRGTGAVEVVLHGRPRTVRPTVTGSFYDRSGHDRVRVVPAS